MADGDAPASIEKRKLTVMQTRARGSAEARPGSRECLDGHVLTGAGYGDAVRWREGDRLERLFKARCDQLRERGRAARGPAA